VESAGYSDLSFLARRGVPFCCGVVRADVGVEGVFELLFDPFRGNRAPCAICMPLWVDLVDGVRVEGKDDKDAWRLTIPLALPVVPLVEGRYERAVVIFLPFKTEMDSQRIFRRGKKSFGLGKTDVRIVH